MTQNRPNFLLIVADEDLGFSDVGCFGSEIKTPNIDRIAKEGALFTDFHASAACSPTRAMLLSGTDSHLAGVGVMSEQRNHDPVRWNKRGHEGYLNHDVAPLPELLRDAGYYTMMSGKWHLGLRKETNPHARGFDRSFSLLPGASNHWGFEPQFGDDFNSFFARIPVLYTEDGKRKVIEPNTTNTYADGFFTSDTYTQTLLRQFQERSAGDAEKPFFAFLPFSAPHYPLQCSAEDRAAYKGIYDDGPTALRERRIAALKRSGIIEQDVEPHPVIDVDQCKVHFDDWQEMKDMERRKSARAMECFAGMVTNMDRNIGKVLDHLESTGQLDNTVIMFMSDNGAEGAYYETIPTMGPDLLRVLNRYYDNSLDNIGNHNSFVWYGPRWAQAATAPGKLYKMYSTEGGIRVPFVVRYPPLVPQNKIIRSFASVMDITPTFLDLARVTHPVPQGQKMGKWKGSEVYGVRGKSWLPFLQQSRQSNGHLTNGDHSRNLAQEEQAIYGEEDFVGWENLGRAALRKGRYKIVWMTEQDFGKATWELFDVVSDPGEIHDLSKRMPEKLNELVKDWDRYVLETGTVWGEPIRKHSGYVPLEEESIGGDPIAETKAWMAVGNNEMV